MLRVFAEYHVAHPVNLVFDAPVRANPGRDRFGRSLLGAQTDDPVDNLLAQQAAAGVADLAADPEDLDTGWASSDTGWDMPWVYSTACPRWVLAW